MLFAATPRGCAIAIRDSAAAAIFAYAISPCLRRDIAAMLLRAPPYAAAASYARYDTLDASCALLFLHIRRLRRLIDGCFQLAPYDADMPWRHTP